MFQLLYKKMFKGYVVSVSHQDTPSQYIN